MRGLLSRLLIALTLWTALAVPAASQTWRPGRVGIKVGLSQNLLLTPTADLSPPTLTRTSSAGTAPWNFTVGIDSTIHEGDVLHIEVAATSGFTALEQNVSHEITGGEISGGVLDLSGSGLNLAPATGAHFMRAYFTRWLTTNSVYSNTIDLTIAGATYAAFDAAKRTTFGGQSGTISGGGYTYNGYDFGSDISFRAATSTALTDPIGYIEFTFTGANSNTGIGFVNGSYDFSGCCVTFGTTSGSFAVTANVGGVSGVRAGSSTWLDFPPPLTTNGTFGLLVHKATGKVWLRLSSGWYPDTPVFNSDGTIASGTGYASGLTTFYWAVVAVRGEGVTVNSGQSAYTYTPPTFTPANWK
jgi:hypothetical protein